VCREASASIAAMAEVLGGGGQHEPVAFCRKLGLGLTRHEAMPLKLLSQANVDLPGAAVQPT